MKKQQRNTAPSSSSSSTTTFVCCYLIDCEGYYYNISNDDYDVVSEQKNICSSSSPSMMLLVGSNVFDSLNETSHSTIYTDMLSSVNNHKKEAEQQHFFFYKFENVIKCNQYTKKINCDTEVTSTSTTTTSSNNNAIIYDVYLFYNANIPAKKKYLLQHFSCFKTIFYGPIFFVFVLNHRPDDQIKSCQNAAAQQKNKLFAISKSDWQEYIFSFHDFFADNNNKKKYEII